MNERTGERPIRVLVFGEDDALASRMAHVFEHCCLMQVREAESLLAEIRKDRPDLIVTGRAVCSMDAVRLLRQVNSLLADSRVKIIISAATSDRGDVITAMREGAFSYFSRPHFEAAFDEMLRHAASSAPWEDSIRVDSATPSWLRIIARCELPTADRVVQFMNEVSDLDGQHRESMGFALKEILMNAMEYGGKFNRERLVEVSYVRGQRMVLYRVRDPGDGFSLDELSHAAVSNPPEEPVRHLEIRDSLGIRPGGFGVLLSKKLVDDLIYSEQGNDVLLIKYLDAQPDAQESARVEADRP